MEEPQTAVSPGCQIIILTFISHHFHTFLTAIDTPFYYLLELLSAKFCNSWRRSMDQNILSFIDVTTLLMLKHFSLQGRSTKIITGQAIDDVT